MMLGAVVLVMLIGATRALRVVEPKRNTRVTCGQRITVTVEFDEDDAFAGDTSARVKWYPNDNWSFAQRLAFGVDDATRLDTDFVLVGEEQRSDFVFFCLPLSSV